MIQEWKDLFIDELKNQIGKRYTLGGGQMPTWTHRNKETKKVIAVYPNKDPNGKWVGFDCCGGIMDALRQATGIDMIPRDVPGMMIAPWLNEIEDNELKEADLIFVDVPGLDENGDVMKNENGFTIYGVWNHVMTFINYTSSVWNIITTRGAGGDHRINPNSQARTDYWNLASFKKVSAKIFENTTRYKYFRINWEWLIAWKRNH